MIAGNENIADVFSYFHDGTITAHKTSGNDLELEIEIEYLANRVNPAFTKFYLTIQNPENISFETWPKKHRHSPRKIENLEEIFSGNPEILEGGFKDGKIQAVMIKKSPDPDYSGGTLTFQADSVTIVDEGKKDYSSEEINGLCEGYWTQWDKKWWHPMAYAVVWFVAKIVECVRWIKAWF